jgi:hypothetical protein
VSSACRRIHLSLKIAMGAVIAEWWAAGQAGQRALSTNGTMPRENSRVALAAPRD